MPLVFSTLTASNAYTSYKASVGDIPLVEHQVIIKGGANVANDRIITPRGVGTEVSDSDLEFLLADPLFKLHLKNGFVSVDTVKDLRDADEAAAKMEGRDESAPDTPNDYAEGEAPVVNATVETKVETKPTASRRARKSS